MNEEDGDLNNWNYFVNTFDNDEALIGPGQDMNLAPSESEPFPAATVIPQAVARRHDSNKIRFDYFVGNTLPPLHVSRADSSGDAFPTTNLHSGVDTSDDDDQKLPASSRTATTTIRVPPGCSDSSYMRDYPCLAAAPSNETSVIASTNTSVQQTTDGLVPAYVVVDPSHPESFYLPMQLLTYQAADGPHSLVWGPVVLPIQLLRNQQNLPLQSSSSQLRATQASRNLEQLSQSMRDRSNERANRIQKQASKSSRQPLTLTSSFEPICCQKESFIDSTSSSKKSSLSSESKYSFFHCHEEDGLGETSMPVVGVSLLSSAERATGFSSSAQGHMPAKTTKPTAPIAAKKSAQKKPSFSQSKSRIGPNPIQKPLTAYNYFFRDERDNIVNWKGEGLAPPVQDWTPERQRAMLEEHWYLDPVKGKRRHRKTHGKLGFTA